MSPGNRIRLLPYPSDGDALWDEGISETVSAGEAAKTIWLRLEPDGGGRRIAGGALHAPASLPLQCLSICTSELVHLLSRLIGFRSKMLKIYEVIE